MPQSRWRAVEPKLATVLREGYTRSLFARDLSAGVVVGIVALPLAIAFAIASGVGPEQGLYTAIIAGFLISALGGSRHQIGGPTGAFVVLVYVVVQDFGYDGLAIATIMAGVLLVAMGLANLGALIRYIPYPVTVGFTSGIAVVIASGQIRDALGLTMDRLPADFVAKLIAYGRAIESVNPWAVALTVACCALIVYLPRVAPRVPATLVALLAATALVHLFGLPVDTVGARFGGVPSGLPSFQFPRFDVSRIPELISPAVSIALLGGIESLLSAVVADGMTGRRHRSNTELVAQGIANVASPLFGGIPATGAIARTATNIKNGAATPIAGVVHAVTLLIILLAAGRWAALIPMPALAAILFVVAWNMSEAHLFRRILSSTRSDTLVLATTFVLTVGVDLIVAIQVGVVLASLLFMRRMSDVASIKSVEELSGDGEDPAVDAAELEAIRRLPPGVEVYEVGGPFFFGAAHKFKTALSDIHRQPAVIVLRMRDIFALDATGLRVLEEMLFEEQRGGPKLVLSGIQDQPLGLLRKSGFLERIGEGRVTRTFGEALDVATRLGRLGVRS